MEEHEYDYDEFNDGDDSPASGTNADGNPMTPAAIRAGVKVASELDGLFLYAKSGWWGYNADGYWEHQLKVPLDLIDWVNWRRYAFADALASDGDTTAAEILAADDTAFAGSMSEKGGLMAALRTKLLAPEPAGPTHLLCTPGGTLNLRNGELMPHSPWHYNRAITRGVYLPEADSIAQRQVLDDHLGKVLTTPGLDAFIQLVSLGLTGRAQSHRGIVLVLGTSGSGKGGLVSLVCGCVGSYGYPLTASYLSTDQHRDIDSVMATMLANQVRFGAAHEVAKSALAQGKTLDVSGDGERSARQPHGLPLRGRLRFQLWLTSVDAPEFDTRGGIVRRLATLRTGKPLEEVIDTDDWPSEIYDALLTLAGRAACEVYQRGYRAPEGEGKDRAVADMDPVRTAVAEILDDSWEGRGLQELLELVKADLPDTTATLLGRKLPDRWATERSGTGSQKVRILVRRPEK